MNETQLHTLYRRWAELAGQPTLAALGWQFVPFLGCLTAVFVDSPEHSRVRKLFALSASSVAFQDLTVWADELQANGDERGEWLTAWLLPWTNEHRAGAILACTPALAARMETLIAAHEQRLRRSKSIPLAAPWNIPPNSTLEIKVDGGAVQTVTFQPGDFFNMRTVTEVELSLAIDSQISGASTWLDGDKLTITSDSAKGSVQIVGGSAAAFSLGLGRRESTQWYEVDFTPTGRVHDSRLLLHTPRNHGRSAYLRDLATLGHMQGGLSDTLLRTNYAEIERRVLAHSRTGSPAVQHALVGLFSPLVVHDEIVAPPTDATTLANAREQLAALMTTRSPVSADSVNAITSPSGSRTP